MVKAFPAVVVAGAEITKCVVCDDDTVPIKLGTSSGTIGLPRPVTRSYPAADDSWGEPVLVPLVVSRKSLAGME
jgi:hypothetical protein